MRGHKRTCKDMRGHERTCEDIREHVRTREDTRGHERTHLTKRITLVQVEVTLHEDTGRVLNRPKHQTAFMTLNWGTDRQGDRETDRQRDRQRDRETVCRDESWNENRRRNKGGRRKRGKTTEAEIPPLQAAVGGAYSPVLVGKLGMSWYLKVCLLAAPSASRPRPEPQITATWGRWLVRFRSQSVVSL